MCGLDVLRGLVKVGGIVENVKGSEGFWGVVCFLGYLGGG